ncbi:hypothetical protein ACS0TY_019208 [Phlomoides rotata]
MTTSGGTTKPGDLLIFCDKGYNELAGYKYPKLGQSSKSPTNSMCLLLGLIVQLGDGRTSGTPCRDE